MQDNLLSVAFCAHVDVIKYRKTLMFFTRVHADFLSFHPQYGCSLQTVESHLNNQKINVSSNIHSADSWKGGEALYESAELIETETEYSDLLMLIYLILNVFYH